MVDCQQETGHLASLGAAPISRAAFLRAFAGAPSASDEIARWEPVPPLADAR